MTTILGLNSIDLLLSQLLQVGVSSEVTSQVDLVQGVIQAFILGIVQGITEFLPISSTAHLIIVTKVFAWKELGSKDFVDAIQFGSVIAILWYFWAVISGLAKGAITAFKTKDWESEDGKIVVGIAVGTIPALTIGFLLKDVIPESSLIIAIMSVIMATLLGLAEKFGTRNRGFDALEIRDGILVGLGQTLALVPGVSRSGSTLTTGLFLGLQREAAAKFSFLLGFPTLTIATLYKSLKIFKMFQSGELPNNIVILLVVGIVSTFIFSYLSIAFLIKYLQTKNTMVFVWYRLAFGISILLAIAAGWQG
ncbi:undecaprenyl-diphosphate phosphatase [Dolichospermum sp. LEGE 00240]|jgi:undecaprenyl-diphosphatase|uniref:undecaprenyl-diphosphate phosphatase n=1 Tax=Dolichospermum sp. LEGE 00240 TaxID=1828603 RepID=UPI00188265E3|nr:undecaprenyl-diphosphate phosphatase [Dolichospermum sp. LEGE 00240]MDM3847528.1 undecaprenyl-diphosphate phosphatase [Aphanizomenon gracile PMC638.10]MDM3850525.1 undecaprenyl-diphosphate phosphatase [Aphanizomenon gracile PMC627.10]MDM3854104.1 undecaprenyl-diphosphate phosphatase [Aphanizomenon gracile PMC649.10]MDM3862654.1 undecaprenyl-diphosphate phosphatase [Aphanizomenon gracile PMC644.10]MBE9251610.1 undecaprenyl-diphosphate phosphatase [Dolichospermum sp. LEGE 00240]